MKRSLIYLDIENIQNSIDLLEVARQIYGIDPYEVYAVAFTSSEPVISDINGKFDCLIQLDDADIHHYDAAVLTEIMEELQELFEFDSILIPATHLGRMLAPRLAMRLHVGLVADVTAIDHSKAGVEMIRPAFSGKIMAGIVNRGKTPIMMSVRQNVFSYQMTNVKDMSVVDFKPTRHVKSKIKLIETRAKEKSEDIRESQVLVSGGGGTKKHFHRLKQLAELIDGQVAASRRIVDDGIASRAIQVGQSGKTVSPKLYFALGIYGSLQHIEGLKNVEYIISVNTNKDAPICSLSDLVVEGDAIEFIEKLTERINRDK